MSRFFVFLQVVIANEAKQSNQSGFLDCFASLTMTTAKKQKILTYYIEDGSLTQTREYPRINGVHIILMHPKVPPRYRQRAVVVNLHNNRWGNTPLPRMIAKSFAQGMAGYTVCDTHVLCGGAD